MYEVSVRTNFAGAHRLNGYQGRCAGLHGHNWEIEVFIRGSELNDIGILIDFQEVKAGVSDILAGLDHTDLNSLEAFSDRNPSSENIAGYLYEQLGRRLNRSGCAVHRVVVQESPGSAAAYWE